MTSCLRDGPAEGLLSKMESGQASLELQKTIKDNTAALHDCLADLKNWEKEIKAVDEQLSSQSNNKEKTNSGGESREIPVRSKSIQGAFPTKGAAEVTPTQAEKSKQTKQVENKQASNNSNKKAKRLPCDYAAWERFDVDKAMASSEEEEVEHKQLKSTTAGRNPRTGKKERATSLKEEGNKLYSSGRLEDAVAKYTQGMALDPTNALLPANRAMAYIKLKKYTAAEADCNRCLKLDSGYIKGFLRRATARLSIGKEELARRDYLKVLEMEPHNKEAKRELEKLNNPLGKQEEAAKTNTEQSRQTPDNDRLSKGQEPTKDLVPAINTTPRPPAEAPRQGATGGREREGRLSTETTVIKRGGAGKKVKIVEVNSGSSSMPSKVANQIMPIEKPPHLRSEKPLKRIPVMDIARWEDMNEQPAVVAVNETDSRKDGGQQDRKTKNPPVSLETAVLVSSRATVPSEPRTSHQFSQDWHRLCSTSDAAAEYLKMISPAFFRNVDLETNTLVEVAEVLVGEGVPATLAAEYLLALSVSHGFSISIMFMETDQKQVFLNLISKCKQVEGHRAKMEELEAAVHSM